MNMNRTCTFVRMLFGLLICAFLLLSQFIVQLLLVPQGTLFGQIMFLASFTVSWGYNVYRIQEPERDAG